MISPAISHTSRVIRTCLIGVRSDHVEPLGVHALGRHTQLEQRSFGSVHHRIGPADEVLKALVAVGQKLWLPGSWSGYYAQSSSSALVSGCGTVKPRAGSPWGSLSITAIVSP